jgi:hypothetical protein
MTGLNEKFEDTKGAFIQRMYSKKGNYNPVSMETIIEKQLSQHFLTINLILSCLHIGVTFGRQSALFLIQKDWKMFGAARLMNLVAHCYSLKIWWLFLHCMG